MKLSKITASVLSVVAAVGILISAFSGCKKEKTPESDSNYLADVNQYSFWSNTSDTAMPSIIHIIIFIPILMNVRL